MLSAGIAVLTGSILASFYPFRIDIYWVSFLPICLYVVYINPKWRVFWLVICSFLWTTAHIHWQLDQRLDDQLNNKRLVVVGEVINIPKRTTDSSRFLLKPDKIEGYQGELPGLIRLTWRNAPDTLSPGQIWRLNVKLKKPHGFQNPAGFDYERWLFLKGIHATGYVLNARQQQIIDSDKLSLNSVRFQINESIEHYCSECLNVGLIQALAIGYRGNIQDSDRLLLQQTGTAHLIAISGLHIGIIAGVFYALGLLIWNRWFYRTGIQRKELALVISFTAALIYSLLAGFDLPAQRAILMLSVFLVSLWSRTAFNLLNSIFATLVLVLVFSPLAVLSESFWLSFSALLIIALGVFLLRSQRSRIKQLFVIQILFSLLFIPVSILIFGQVHIASLLANLVAVPLISFVVVPLNFLLLTLLWLPHQLLEILYETLDGLLGLLMSYLNGLQEIGLRAQPLADMQIWMIGLVILILLLLILPRNLLFPRYWMLLLALIIIWPKSPKSEDEVRLTVLDVGMGTSVVIQTKHHSLVYDFGPGNKKGYSLGKWVLMPYLMSQGIHGLDRVIISHADSDHLGGLYAIRSELRHGLVYSGTPDEVKSRIPELAGLLDCHSQQPWRWDGVSFEFVSASLNRSDSENNRSCVLKISLGDRHILISGDIEASQENNLLKAGNDQLKSEILIAPHHGSLTSSSPAFINAVNAKNVIFTSGYLNRWGFPRPEILHRYRKTGASTYRTDQDGAILINCQPEQCHIKRYRQHRPRLWY